MHGATRSAPPHIRVAVCNLSHVFCSVGNVGQKTQPLVVDRRPVGLSTQVATLETKLASVWPLPKDLPLRVRYQFGSYPSSYNDLAKAGKQVKGAAAQCHTVLATLEKDGRVDKGNEKMISHLLNAIDLFDKQCEVWGNILSKTQSQKMPDQKRVCDEGAANPFKDLRDNLLALRMPLMGARTR
jgi:hypothetical protein